MVGSVRAEGDPAQDGANRKNEDDRRHQRTGNIDAQEQASEEKVLQPPDISRGTRDQFPRVRSVMVTERETLDGIVNGGANVAQCLLHQIDCGSVQG